MKIYKDEIFVRFVSSRAKNYDEALNLVNNHAFEMELVFILQMEKFLDTLQQL